MIEGIIKFSGYRAEKITYNYKLIESDFGDNNTSISPEFMIQLVHKDVGAENNIKEENFFNIIFGVRVGLDKGEKIPFSAEVVLRGFFSFRSEDVSEYEKHEREKFDKDKFLLTSCCAILFPYLRSTLSDVTSKSMHTPILLPTINFNNFIEHRDISEFLLDPSNYSAQQ